MRKLFFKFKVTVKTGNLLANSCVSMINYDKKNQLINPATLKSQLIKKYIKYSSVLCKFDRKQLEGEKKK